MSSSDDAGRCSWYSCLDGHTGSGLEHHDRRSRTRSVVGDWQRKRSKRSIARWVTTVGDRLLCSRLLSVCCILPYARTIELRPVLTISACPYIILQSVWLCMTLAAYSFVEPLVHPSVLLLQWHCFVLLHFICLGMDQGKNFCGDGPHKPNAAIRHREWQRRNHRRHSTYVSIRFRLSAAICI